MPPPARMPLAEIFPSGPVSNVAGGSPDSGPVIAGCESGAAAAGAEPWGSAGALWAVHTEASARENANPYTKFVNRISSPSRFSPPLTNSRFQAKKNAQKHQ